MPLYGSRTALSHASLLSQVFRSDPNQCHRHAPDMQYPTSEMENQTAWQVGYEDPV